MIEKNSFSTKMVLGPISFSQKDGRKMSFIVLVKRRSPFRDPKLFLALSCRANTQTSQLLYFALT